MKAFFKRMTAVLISAALCFPCTSVDVQAEEWSSEEFYTYGELTYMITAENTISITGCSESAVSVEIPAEINGLPVKSVGECAFYYCTALTAISIPDTVTSIGEDAFFGCEVLTEVFLPDGVESIGTGAFAYCDVLKTITIPDSVTSIGLGAFCCCPALSSITIPDGVTKIERNTFRECSSMTAITLPDTVTSIGDNAFTFLREVN